MPQDPNLAQPLQGLDWFKAKAQELFLNRLKELQGPDPLVGGPLGMVSVPAQLGEEGALRTMQSAYKNPEIYYPTDVSRKALSVGNLERGYGYQKTRNIRGSGGVRPDLTTEGDSKSYMDSLGDLWLRIHQALQNNAMTRGIIDKTGGQ